MSRLAAVLLWSVISAAFIGPGTVTAAASAGAEFRFVLLWALAFSTVACLVLQEASARLTVVSGLNLGQALRERYPAGVIGTAILVIVLGAVVLGCAAYEAGNILGGVAGAVLVLPFSTTQLTLVTVVLAACLLWFNSPKRVAMLLSALVAVMGVAFLWTAIRLAPALEDLVAGALVPRLPEGSSLLAVALVGTTVVPYNLFLGSGLARGQSLAEVRFGLSVAVTLGGLISMGVLIVGAATPPPLDYAQLAETLAAKLGGWGRTLFGVGLFAAGLSSAVTAPLAAAITAKSVFGPRSKGPETSGGAAVDSGWRDGSLRFRSVWGGVLLVGLVFGLTGVKPVPVIIIAQALNGVLLPLVAAFLLLTVNDRDLMGSQTNSRWSNLLMGGIFVVSLFLGLTNVAKAGGRMLNRPTPSFDDLLLLTGAIAAIVALAMARRLARRG